jgi:uncharacterized damage-inducible protein DinB
MDRNCLRDGIRASKEFLDRSTRVLEEEDSNFAPKEGMMTCAQQVAHIGQTINWFLQAASRPEGFDINFEKHAQELKAVSSLKAARQITDRAYAALLEAIDSRPEKDWQGNFPKGMVMSGEPKERIFPAIIEHTAHHRGALTVYSRLRGKKPAMPYMDM